jgi:rhodanese-related sulfurtransferase
MDTSISPADFHAYLQLSKNPQILDIRTEAEFEDFNIGGTHLPFEQLLYHPNLPNLFAPSLTVIVCYTGLQSEIARKILAKRGIPFLQNLETGLEGYLAFLGKGSSL